MTSSRPPATSSPCTPSSTGCRSNLCVRVPDGVAPEHAAFSTVGAIAMQGVRRAEPQLGEVACVIGLGLIGQLVVRLLVAAGVRVVGLDTVEARCRLAEKAGRWPARGPDAGRRRRWSRRSRSTATRRSRVRPRVPRCRRRLQRPRRAGGAAGARPRPGRRHRQDQARPAVERLLREGARRPLLAVLRARPLRRPLRARRASTTPPATSGGPSAATSRRFLDLVAGGPAGRVCAGLRRAPIDEATDGLRRAGGRARSRESGTCSQYPDAEQAAAAGVAPQRRPGAARGTVASARSGPRVARSGSASSERATTPPRCCCPTWRPTRVSSSPPWPPPVRCRRSTPSASSASST